MQPQPLLNERMSIGESIIWDDRQRALLWVDVGYPSFLHRFDIATGDSWKLEYDGLLSGVVLTDQDDVVLLLSDTGIKQCRLSEGRVSHVCDVEPTQPENRCNDLGVDPNGRLWFGTMQNNLGERGNRQSFGKRGSLYCLAGNQLTRHETDLGIPNTLQWSPDGKSFYLGDSLAAKIYRYDFDGVSIHNQRIFSDFKLNGVPDGSAIDAQGQLWNCRWGDAAIFVFTPEGQMAKTIPIPALQVTSCTFGGPDMTTLYVTTARHELTSSQQAEFPLSGSVFALEIGAVGSTRGRVKRW